jgi:NAD(P)-dependent dehydrogenase (short-subunit alcohol dehydrogenase family)
MTTLSTLVISGEFAGRTALIVGGSRGLGAVTAKLLAAGGARIIVTYATGKEEAEALVAEIRAAHGEPAATSLAFDMRSEAGLQLSSLPDITHLYYFATPRISHQSTAVFDLSVFEEFTRFYIDGFHALARWLIHNRKSLRHIFYPSSVFVTSHASGMTEYAMVKAAAEILCADLMAATGLSIAVPRIPRVLTDQTATVPPVETQDPVAVMLPLLRAENHAPS